MGRDYPMVRDVAVKFDPDGTECCACQKAATGKVRIAWDYMRGNDDYEPACERHYAMADKQPSRFIAHMMTKHKHFAKAGDA